jgi:hypothetical protein
MPLVRPEATSGLATPVTTTVGPDAAAQSSSYPVIGVPPDDEGAPNATDNDPSPAVTATEPGTPGTGIVRTLMGADVLSPMTLDAVTVQM